MHMCEVCAAQPKAPSAGIFAKYSRMNSVLHFGTAIAIRWRHAETAGGVSAAGGVLQDTYSP